MYRHVLGIERPEQLLVSEVGDQLAGPLPGIVHPVGDLLVRQRGLIEPPAANGASGHGPSFARFPSYMARLGPLSSPGRSSNHFMESAAWTAPTPRPYPQWGSSAPRRSNLRKTDPGYRNRELIQHPREPVGTDLALMGTALNPPRAECPCPRDDP